MKAAWALIAATAGFWCLVFWAADAFTVAEVATVVGLIVLVSALWLWWEVRHAVADPEEPDEFYVPDDWLFPPREDPPADVSTVRHGGLGR